MSTEEKADFSTEDVNEAIDEPNAITPAPLAESETQPIWARRSILKAAALGTAAAALINVDRLGGLRLGPLSASADDLSRLHPGDASERESVRIRTTWRARRQRSMPFVVEERSHRGFPADDLVKVGHYPDVGEPVQICKASSMRCGDLDQ